MNVSSNTKTGAREVTLLKHELNALDKVRAIARFKSHLKA